MILNGKIICFTGFSGNENDSLSKVVKSLGGFVTIDLTKHVNCLICKKIGTDKHIAAAKKLIPCVTTDWLLSCQQSNTLLAFDSFLVKVPVFSGCTFTVSGIYGTARSTLIQNIQDYGGNYSSDLIPDEVTHLICEAAAGDKYHFAKEEGNIKILKAAWVEECINSSGLVEEKPYAVKESSTLYSIASSTVQRDITPSESKKTAEYRDSASYSTNDLSSELLATGSDTIFTHDNFFVHGFSSEMADYLTAIILHGGGFRSHLLTASVTIILLGEDADSRLVQQAIKHPTAMCVKASWIVDKHFDRI